VDGQIATRQAEYEDLMAARGELPSWSMDAPIRCLQAVVYQESHGAWN